MQAMQKYFNNGEKCRKFTNFFLGCCVNISVFLQEIKEPTHISQF